MPSEQQTTPWSDFLQRMLLSVGQATQASAEALVPDGTLPQPAPTMSNCAADLPAG